MISMNSVGPALPIILGGLMLVLLWGNAFLLYSMITYGRGRVRCILVGVMIVIEYLFIQVMIYRIYHWNSPSVYIPRYEAVLNMYIISFVAVVFGFFVITAVLVGEIVIWNRNHISRLSVKESLDKLPIGVCYYLESGLPILVNHGADMVSLHICGRIVRDGQEFYKLLKDTGEFIEMPGGRYLAYARREILVEGKNCYVITLNDVTEEIERSNELERENKRLSELNAHLRNLNETIDQVAIQSEILETKVRIHDSLGQILMMTRLYMKHENGEETDEADNANYVSADVLKEKWKEAIRFLDSPEEMKDNQLEKIFSVAEDVGIKIDIDGKLPTDEVQIDLLAKAIHECMTNAIRHAGADRLFVKLSYKNGMRIEISNNGKQPSGQLSESGGLANLRGVVEEQGATMELQWEGGFKMIICYGVSNGEV